MKWLNLNSLRKRYAALTVILAIIMLSFSWYSQNKISTIKKNIDINIESRNILIHQNREARDKIWQARDLLFKFQADRARTFYQKAFESLPDEDRYSQRTGLIMSEVYHSLLDEIEEDGFRVLEHKIKLTPLRKFWLTWRASRREKKRHKHQQRLSKTD